MNDCVTLGQYLPGDSIIHCFDPRVKIFLTILYMVSIFFVDTYWGYLCLASFVVLTAVVAQVPFRRLLKGLRPIFFIVVLTALLNLLMTPGRDVFTWWIFHITDTGIHLAVFIAIRIVLLVMGTSLLTLTTSPLSLTDGLESILSPLRLVRFPVHEISMMISIALRFIPTLFEETDKIMKAQKARGADFESGNMLKRAKSMIPLMVPLFLNAFHRAAELGTAMEARCYRGGDGRTRLNPLVWHARDVWVLVLGNVVLFAIMLVL